MPADDSGSFSHAWDRYAQASDSARPGDEWGDPELWRAWFRELFVPFHVGTWQRAVEIGQGSGKYSEMVLEAGCQELLCLDVAPTFLELCAQHLARFGQSGRLHLAQLDERDPEALCRAVEQVGWREHVDAVYSIDAMVHLPLPQLTAYLRGAALVLRPHGVFLGTFADATTAGGRQKLLDDVDRTVRDGGDPSTGCFHFADTAIVRGVAEALGYEVAICAPDPIHGRDGLLAARLIDRSRAREAAARAAEVARTAQET